MDGGGGGTGGHTGRRGCRQPGPRHDGGGICRGEGPGVGGGDSGGRPRCCGLPATAAQYSYLSWCHCCRCCCCRVSRSPPRDLQPAQGL